MAVPTIVQCARLSLTVFELQMCKNYVTHIVPLPEHDYSLEAHGHQIFSPELGKEALNQNLGQKLAYRYSS